MKRAGKKVGKRRGIHGLQSPRGDRIGKIKITGGEINLENKIILLLRQTESLECVQRNI